MIFSTRPPQGGGAMEGRPPRRTPSNCRQPPARLAVCL